MLVLAVALCACGPSTDARGETTTAANAPSVVSVTPTASEAPGSAMVTIGDDTFSFTADVCTIADDGLHVEAHGAAGTLTILHASPPTRQPPEPSFAVFLIEGGTRYEAPPAAVQLDTYDPAAGRAEGAAFDVIVAADPGATLTALFSIVCTSDV